MTANAPETTAAPDDEIAPAVAPDVVGAGAGGGAGASGRGLRRCRDQPE